MHRVSIENAATVVLEPASASTLELVFSGITATAAVAAAIVAYRALATWRSQLKGQVRFELARKLMTAVNDMAAKYHAARSAVMWISEYPEEYNNRNRNDIDDDMEADAIQHVLQNRYQPIHQAGAAIVAMLPEIQTLFPDGVAAAVEGFLDVPWEWRSNVQIYVAQVRRGHFERNVARDDREALARLRDEQRTQQEAVFAAPPRRGQEVANPQTARLLAAQTIVAERLRPYLELSSK